MRTNSKNGIPTIKARVLNIHRENRNMQIKTTRVQNSFLSMLFLMSFGAGISQAAINACTTTFATETAIPATSTANGCRQVDISFSNLSENFATGGMNYFATGAVPNTGATPDTVGAIVLNLDACPTPGTACTGGTTSNWRDQNGSTAGSTSGTIAFQATANNGFNSVSEAGYRWALTGISFTPTISSLTGTDLIQAVVTFCFASPGCTTGTGTAGGSFTVQWASTAGGTTTTLSGQTGLGTGVSISSGTGVTNPTLSFTAAQNFTDVYIRTALTFTTSGASNVSLDNFAVQFDQTATSPEPGTFGMLSAALVGLGVLAKRRKKA